MNKYERIQKNIDTLRVHKAVLIRHLKAQILWSKNLMGTGDIPALRKRVSSRKLTAGLKNKLFEYSPTMITKVEGLEEGSLIIVIEEPNSHSKHEIVKVTGDFNTTFSLTDRPVFEPSLSYEIHNVMVSDLAETKKRGY